MYRRLLRAVILAAITELALNVMDALEAQHAVRSLDAEWERGL
jgi:hypothetical protein